MSRYKQIRINSKSYYVHRKVMEESLGRELSSLEVVHHKDKNTYNNNLDNLVLLSGQAEHLKTYPPPHLGKKHTDESRRKMSVGVRKKLPMAKLKSTDIPTIRKMIKDGVKYWLLAWVYQVDTRSISSIKCNVTWAWVE